MLDQEPGLNSTTMWLLFGFTSVRISREFWRIRLSQQRLQEVDSSDWIMKARAGCCREPVSPKRRPEALTTHVCNSYVHIKQSEIYNSWLMLVSTPVSGLQCCYWSFAAIKGHGAPNTERINTPCHKNNNSNNVHIMTLFEYLYITHWSNDTIPESGCHFKPLFQYKNV